MGMGKKWFGGRGTGRPQGNAHEDAVGAVRRSPDGEWLAIMWPSPPSPCSWWVMDNYGSAGYEKPERVAHWPMVGAVPCSPAAGMALLPHPAPPREERGVQVTQAPPPDDGALCANPKCGHTYAAHHRGFSKTRCASDEERSTCAGICPRFYVDTKASARVDA